MFVSLLFKRVDNSIRLPLLPHEIHDTKVLCFHHKTKYFSCHSSQKSAFYPIQSTLIPFSRPSIHNYCTSQFHYIILLSERNAKQALFAFCKFPAQVQGNRYRTGCKEQNVSPQRFKLHYLRNVTLRYAFLR